MGLFDSVAGAVLGQVMGEKAGMAKIAMEMLNQQGGLTGILTKFQQAGFAEQVATWVGKGENASISANQIKEVLGSNMIANMAAKFGISPELLSNQLAQHLPTIIDKMTPNGKIDENSSHLLNTVLGVLK
jgi:uncharacterized protein YidB (DUF937 family)